MPYNINGVFVPLSPPNWPPVPATKILSSRHIAVIEDLILGINQGVNAGRILSTTTGGSGAAYTASLGAFVTSLAPGKQFFQITFHANSVADATLNINGLGALLLQEEASSGALVNMTAGRIQAGRSYFCVVLAGLIKVVGLPDLPIVFPFTRNTHTGFTMSTAGGSGTMTIGQGQCADSTNSVLIDRFAALNKTTAGFAEGNNAGGLDTGTTVLSAIGATCSFATNVMTCTVAPTQGSFQIGQVINSFDLPADTVIVSFGTGSGGTGTYNLSTAPGSLSARTCAGLSWYHYHSIRRPDTGATDILYSRSATAPTMPANYTQRRWIGVGLIAPSGLTWVKFNQVDDRVMWDAPIVERESISAGGFHGLTVPSQIRTLALCGLTGSITAPVTYGAHLYDLSSSFIQGGSGSGLSVAGVNQANNYAFGGRTEVRTDLGARVGLSTSFGPTSLSLATFGYNIAEAKGRNA